MNYEVEFVIIWVLWSLGCVAAGAGLVFLFQYIRIDRTINDILDIEDRIINEYPKDSQEYKDKLLEELDMMVERIESLRLMKDEGLISEYDYNYDMKNYERRVSEIESEIDKEDSESVQP